MRLDERVQVDHAERECRVLQGLGGADVCECECERVPEGYGERGDEEEGFAALAVCGEVGCVRGWSCG